MEEKIEEKMGANLWNLYERKFSIEFEYGIEGASNCLNDVVTTDSELIAVKAAIHIMDSYDVNSSNLMYCRVEEIIPESEMRTNVLLWIGE